MEESNKNIETYIVAFLTNDISEKELETLSEWKKLSSDNQERFDQFVSAWEKSEHLAVYRQIDIANDWDCVYNKIKNIDKSKRHTKSIFIPLRKIAAVLIPLIFISIGGLLYWNVPGFGKLTAYQTSNSIKKIDLPDGSTVTLNKNSKIIFQNNIASNTERDIQLSGEGFFEVSHNNTPFNVEIGEATVSVLGTQFNVEGINQDVYVSVITGRVSVSANQSQIILSKGERGIVHDGNLTEEIAETTNDIYWCNKVLKFKQANLSDICTELQKNFDIIKEVKYNTGDISTKVTTTFKNQSLDEIIEELKIHFNKKITFDGSILTVSD